MTNEDWQDNARMITESARAVVPADGDLGRVRGLRFKGPGYDPEMMQTMAELGWPLMRVREDAGGLGLGMRETCALMEVLGRGLVPEPVLSNMLAARLLQEALPEAALDGSRVLVTAWQDATGAADWSGMTGPALNGVKTHVPGGADLFAVVLRDGVAVVPRDAAGLSIQRHELLDGTSHETLSFQEVHADLLPRSEIDFALQEARLAHSAYLLGLSDRALEITLDYLRIREQFGRPIGSFQALQHRATELKIELELSRAAIFATARRFDTGADARMRKEGAARCKRRAADLAMHVSREAIQMHGAMGITDEADISLFARKAMVEANMFGSARQQRATLSALLDQEKAA